MKDFEKYCPLFINQLPTACCLVSSDGSILWANMLFSDIFLSSCNSHKNNAYNIFQYILTKPDELKNFTDRGIIHAQKGAMGTTQYFSISVSPHTVEDEELFLITATNQTKLIRERKTTTLLINIAKAEHESRNLDELFSHIQHELNTVMDAHNMFIVLWDKLRHKLTLPYFIDEHDIFDRFPKGKTLSGYAIETGKSLLLNENDISKLSNEGLTETIGTPAKSWMGVPLRNQSEVVGLIAIQSYKSAFAYSPDDLKILEFVSAQIAISIERKENELELKLSKEKAEQADKLKTSFLANMSHEIRTPLNAILGFSNILSTGNLEQDKLDYFAKIIDNSGKRLMTVIDDIIDVSMIQSNQLKLDYSTFNINELIEELFVLYKTQNQDQLEKLDFKVRICEDPGHCILYSDKNRLFQVLRNLLDNAFKFTEEGFIEFGLSASDKDELVLFVKDTGIGIEEEKTKIVFNTFRQAHEGLSRKYEGTGLGLSIVSGIVKQLGGNVWVESAPGQGAAFYVSVPRKTRTSQFVQQSEQRPKEDRWERRLAVKRIVSFEDDPASIQYLKSVVNLLGYELINFDLPETGIEYLRKHSADLVLMDVRLPQMTGLEATRIIKSDIPGLPVIIQTAYAMKGDREKAFEAGCDDYLTKPVSLKDLKGKIVQYIEQAN